MSILPQVLTTPTTPVVKVSATDLPGRYFVCVESATGLHIENEHLLSLEEAWELAGEVKAQIAFQKLASDCRPNRMARAMSLVADGHVCKNGTGYLVMSQNGHGVYHVSADFTSCGCPDMEFNRPEGGCKHMMAAKLYSRSKADAEMDALLAEVRSNPEPLTAGELEAMAEAQIGHDESRYPFRY